jgi:hypothetical protein
MSTPDDDALTRWERKAGEIIAQHLHERDPRYDWVVRRATPEEMAERARRDAAENQQVNEKEG